MGVFVMPSLGADMEAATLAEWLVRPGDEVERGDVIAVVETQKGAIEIEVFEEGRVEELVAEVGQELPVGAPLALILGAGEARPERLPEPPAPEARRASPAASPERATPPTPAPTRTGQVAASPAARVRAKELGLDLSAVPGSGPGGAIVLADVEGAAAPAPRQHAGSEEAEASTPAEEMRKAIAAAMSRSKRTIPHFYVSETIDLQPAADWLEARNAERPPAERLLLGALFVRAAVLAAARVPAMNGHFVDGAFRPSERVSPGVAIALRGGGLVAPALVGADGMSLSETMAGMRDLVARARAGRLRSSEITGATITVSSLGEVGAEAMTGVIFPPQVALVALGAPCRRPWVVGGEVLPRRVVTLTVSADHRVSDGRQAARFVAEFAERLSRPEAL
jgi:pyruvate dehydrogenase E2 component (dihydrolipoamide acetyltransferase)